MTKKKIGIALSSGSIRGFSQVGVLKALVHAGIPIEMIAGSSAGAMIGSAFATGRSVEDIEKIALSIPWDRMFDFKLSSKGIIGGKNWQKFIEIFTQGKSFKETKIPLYVTTVNITKQKKQVFHSGDLQRAILASCSIPGIVPPVYIDGEEFVDGGVIDPIPFQVLKEKGCNIIIAVDLSDRISRTFQGDEFMKKTSAMHQMHRTLLHDDIESLFEFMEKNRILPRKLARWVDRWTQSMIEWMITPARAVRRMSGKPSLRLLATMYDSYDMIQRELLRERIKNTKDVIFIRPNLSGISKRQFWEADLYIHAGEVATRKALPEIKKAIGNRKHGKS